MTDEIEYQGARFYKCALQVNPYSYVADYQGGSLQDEQTYNQQILEKCQKNKIKVVGLADHGKVESSEGLRKYLQGGGITVFPGYEIASSEKIHMVCLYGEETTKRQLNQFLGQLIGENTHHLANTPTYPSSLSCEDIAKKVRHEQQGFWYAAHMTGRNGLLRLSGDGDNFIHIWKRETLVIAGQIPGSIDDLADVPPENLGKYQEIIKNRNSNYKRQKPIAIINAKDVKQPADLDHESASCAVKMTTPDFEAFKQAFYDPESRIRLNHQLSDTPYSFINSIRWDGGFFDGQKIACSKHLNTVIGGRGTGKSTLIESIRYVLDLPVDNDNSKAIDGFRKNVFSDSKITLVVDSKAQQGNRYAISRRYGEQPVVTTAGGEVSNLRIQDILPEIKLLGQNEILEIERDENKKLALIHSFLPDSHRLDKTINEAKSKLEKNRKKWIAANEEYEILEAIINSKDRLQEKTKQFKELGIEDKLKNVQLLERENGIEKAVDGQFHEIGKWLNQYQNIFDLAFLQDSNISDLPNKTNIKNVRELFENLKTKIDPSVEQSKKALQASKQKYQEEKLQWQAKSDAIKDKLNKAIAQLPDHAGKTGKELGSEYTKIVKQLTTIEKQETAYERQKALIAEIKREREKLLEDYRNTAFERFTTVAKKAEMLNQGELKNKVRITVSSRTNLEELKDFLTQIEGIGAAKIKWLNDVADNKEVDLIQWAKWIADNDANSFLECYKTFGLTEGTARKLCGISLEQRLLLEEIELKDGSSIELNIDHGHEPRYVPLDRLSTGQKCTAILNLLLLNRDDPLIIDQPEDNLDNAFIADRIVHDLRRSKTKRQFLFATHNANIPVFGDAELIIVLNSSKDKGFVKDKGFAKEIGSIDKPEVGRHAAEILEGGKYAFNVRKEKYGF